MYSKNDLDNILKARDLFEVGSDLWGELNYIKSNILENLKPSTNEKIIAYNEGDLDYISEGFFHTDNLPRAKTFIDKRSLLEYANGSFRHPIPYIIVRYENKYFFTLREQGSGELRLIGKKGMIGGHVGKEGIYEGMKREIEEEAGIVNSMIKSIKLRGLIKSNYSVDQDHLGCIYEIELNTDKIKAEEDGVLSGLWINTEDLYKHYESFESWSKIVYDNLLKEIF